MAVDRTARMAVTTTRVGATGGVATRPVVATSTAGLAVVAASR